MGGIGQGLSTVSSTVTNWAKQPFTQSMDLTGWALFTGLIIALSISWKLVLHDVTGKL